MKKKEKKKGILIRSFFSRLAAEQFYYSHLANLAYDVRTCARSIINVYKVVCSSILIVCKIIFSWIMEEELWIEEEAEKI